MRGLYHIVLGITESLPSLFMLDKVDACENEDDTINEETYSSLRILNKRVFIVVLGVALVTAFVLGVLNGMGIL